MIPLLLRRAGPILAIFAVALLALTADAQAPQSQVIFQFDRPVAGVAAPHYTMEVHADGSALYRAEVAIPKSAEVQHLERPLTFTPATAAALFASLGTLRSSGFACASHAKNIADSGTKTLTYTSPEGGGTCTYNFSESKAVVAITTIFEGVEYTLEEGRALDFKHRFDRLGLDAEMSALSTAAENGKALELGNIASTLRTLAEDTELIQRVRLRAAKLLEHVPLSG